MGTYDARFPACATMATGTLSFMVDTPSTDRPNPLHVAIAKLEEEMIAALSRSDVPGPTRIQLQRRLRELKAKAGLAVR
jgi:hypothetical protein